MDHPITITDAAPGDADTIRRLMAEVIEHDVAPDPAWLQPTLDNVNANLEVWLAVPQRCVHLVAREPDRIVGVVLVKDFWNLCSLFVRSDVQGRGIGRALLDAAAARCRGRSEKAALHLNAAARAIPFYLHLGFVERASTQPLPPGYLPMQRPL